MIKYIAIKTFDVLAVFGNICCRYSASTTCIISNTTACSAS